MSQYFLYENSSSTEIVPQHTDSSDENQATNTQIEANPKYESSDPIYDWKDITQEFFEAVKGKILYLSIDSCTEETI